MTRPAVAVNILRTEGADASVPLPSYETEGAAGMDVRASLTSDQREAGLMLAPGDYIHVPTGLIMEVPVGYEMQVRPRSGLAFKHGVDRIAQFVFAPVSRVEWHEARTVSGTKRGGGGFGSTGL